MKKIIYILLLITLLLTQISCNKYLCISKPDKNDNAIMVGFLYTLYFGNYPRAWIVNVKTRTIEQIDVIFNEREDNN